MAFVYLSGFIYVLFRDIVLLYVNQTLSHQATSLLMRSQKKVKQCPKGKNGFNIYFIISKQTTQYYKILSAACHTKHLDLFSLKKGHYQTSKIGINTNYVQIPAKIILLKNPTNSKFTSIQSIKQKHLTQRDTQA